MLVHDVTPVEDLAVALFLGDAEFKVCSCPSYFQMFDGGDVTGKMYHIQLTMTSSSQVS